MDKSELIKAVAADTGLTQKDVRKMVASLEKTITETLEAGEEVRLIGFMTVKPVAKKARKGRNPVSGAPVNIPNKLGLAIEAGQKPKGRC
ncbi:HU family DNA-binding protein [Peribacillus sp. NPDC097198]|uniref:HU family DNA-binding protein n=1 Tax=Peribacillus sp. NPDC097198 TaxID=3364397 RepID=UPI00381FEA43